MISIFNAAIRFRGGNSLIMLALIFSCCKRPDTTVPSHRYVPIPDSVEADTPTLKTSDAQIKSKPVQPEIYGDTVWVYPYGAHEWYDTIIGKGFKTYLSVMVDTTDFIVDTVRSKKGSRIVIGYNHKYRLEFFRNKKAWFTLEFSKKNELRPLLEGTEYWMESNLDVFRNLVYNEKYKKFIIEYDINPRYNYGSVFYLVIDAEGKLDHIGTSNSWGGGGPDGTSFLTSDRESYVTCFEVYYFQADTAVGIDRFATLAARAAGKDTTLTYENLHALRVLKENKFLTVFHPAAERPEADNALILGNDTSLIASFRYEGLMEEMDAILLYIDSPITHESYLYDTDREVLICIARYDSIYVFEFPLINIRSVSGDTINSSRYRPLDFEAFSSYRFYIDSVDHSIYYSP